MARREESREPRDRVREEDYENKQRSYGETNRPWKKERSEGSEATSQGEERGLRWPKSGPTEEVTTRNLRQGCDWCGSNTEVGSGEKFRSEVMGF